MASEAGRLRRASVLLMAIMGMILLLFLLDVPQIKLMTGAKWLEMEQTAVPASLMLQGTSAHSSLENTGHGGYHGNRPGCPEKISDLVSSGAPVMAADALDHFSKYNISGLESMEFLPNFRSPCWLQRSKHFSSGGQESRDKGVGVALRCLPAVFLAGMPKCGTTSLHISISRHPAIASRSKEPHFWTRNWNGEDEHPFSVYSNAIGAQEALFGCNLTPNGAPYHDRLTIDSSASTFWDMRKLFDLSENQGNLSFLIPHLLQRLVPDARMIVIFRDPVERMYSDYLYFTPRRAKSLQDFHQRVNDSISRFQQCASLKSPRYCAYTLNDLQIRLRVGLYSIYVNDWLAVYSREQFHFIQLEEFSQAPGQHTNRIFKFLNLDTVDVRTSSVQRNQRPAKHRHLGDMWNETRTLLCRFYAPYNRRLSQMLDSDLYLWGYSC